MRSWRWVVVLIFTAVVTMLTGNGGGASAQNTFTPVAIGVVAAVDEVSVFASVDNGIYRKHGLDVKVTVYPTGVEVVNALAAGQIQIGMVGPTPFVASASKGVPLVLIVVNHGTPNSMSYSANQGIVASAKSGVRVGDLKGLAGKKIGVPFGADPQPYLDSVLAGAGVSPQGVTLVNLSPPDAAVALRQGAIDAAALFEPWTTVVLAEVPGSVRVVEGHAPSWFGPGIGVTTRQELAQQRNVLVRVLAAQAETEQWVRHNLDKAAQVDTRWITGLNSEVATRAIRYPVFDMRISKLTIEGFNKNYIPALVKMGVLHAAVDIAKFTDASVILQVQRDSPQLFDDLPPIAPRNQLRE